MSELQELEKGESKKIRRSRSGFWFGVIILTLVFSLAGIGYYLFQQLRDQQTGLGGAVKGEMSKKMGDYQSQLAAIQSQLAALESNIAGKDNHFTKTLADFSQLHNQKLEATHKELTGAVHQVQRQLGKTRGDWLMADAEYLLSIANERLHLIGDVNTTREALEAADQRLRESGDAGAFKVREEIAKEQAVLRTVSVPDVVGLYSSLQTLQDSVDKLSLLLPYSGKAPAPENKSHKQIDKDKEANDLLDSAISEIEGMVTIRRTDQPIKEILTPEEAQFIREQLRVKLEMVKIALIQRHEVLYKTSLADAKKWLGQHFNKDANTNNLTAELDKLNETKINSHFPDISLSLKMLRDITKLRIETDKSMPAEEKAATTEPEPAAPETVNKEANKPSTSSKPLVPAKPAAEAVPAKP